MEIQSTTNYSIFTSITSNREVNEAHVKALMKSIQENNLLSINPIMVNTEFGVIDGQHRLEAAERLSERIYYIVSDKVSKADISVLNSVSLK